MASAAKNFIKSILPRPVIDHLIYLFYYKLMRRGYFAQSALDKKLKRYINYDKGFFVELGANDGFTASNTLYYEQKRNWRGILIEPSPNLFLSCVYYRGKDGNSIYCNACVPFDFREKYVDIDYAYLMSVSKNLISDDTDKDNSLKHAKRNFNKYQKSLTFGAVARTLNSLLDESQAPKIIDLLSLDVEGVELDVLKGVNHSEYRFKYILVECRNIERLSEYLKQCGYKLIEKLSHHDYLFCQS